MGNLGKNNSEQVSKMRIFDGNFFQAFHFQVLNFSENENLNVLRTY